MTQTAVSPARTSLALFVGGFVTFSLLYSVQPLLPTLADEFQVNAATSSLALSVASGALALSMLAAAALADRKGRRPAMVASVVASSLISLLVPLCPTFPLFLGVRLLLGAALAGLPAVAMAYLAEEVSAETLGAAMGIYIAGNALGGMSGRLTVGLLTHASSWRTALAVQGGICLLASLWFARNLPPSRHFRPSDVDMEAAIRNIRAALASPALRPLFAIPFLLMGSFSALYNYIAFLLMKPPYSLDHAQVGWIFLLYLVGMIGSAALGRLADRVGRARILPLGIVLQGCGAVVTLLPGLWTKVAGVGLFTFGFFGAHATASGWVGARSGELKATAATLYLLAYYAGVTFGGWIGGYFWIHLGWGGVVLMCSLAVAGALGVALRIGAASMRPPRGTPSGAPRQGAASGRMSRKMFPRTGTASSSTDPPCASAVPFTSESPRPVPPISRERPPSTR